MANTDQHADGAARRPLPGRFAVGMGVAGSVVVAAAAAAGAGTVAVATLGALSAGVILAVGLARERVVRPPLAPLGDVYENVVIRAPRASQAGEGRSARVDAA